MAEHSADKAEAERAVRVPHFFRRQSMGWAALIMGSSVLLSRFIGLIRDKVISYLFGATLESDLYFAAFVVPDFLNYLLAGGYFSITLIPLLAARFREDEEDGWRFFSAVFTWTVAAGASLTALGMAWAPALARLAAPGVSAAATLRLSLFLRIILPAQICFLAGSCITAVLYLRKQFIVPALVPLIYNGTIILGGILLRAWGMAGFCWGVLAGALVGNFLLPLVAARRGGGLRFALTFRHPSLRRYIAVALPLMIGQSVVVWDEQLTRIFGTLAGPGAVSWLNYARRIMMVPVGAVAQAAGVAAFPFLAELAARSDSREFDRTLGTAIRHTVAILVPVCVWAWIAAPAIVTFVFQQGRFTPQDTAHTAGLLRVFLAAALCWGIQQVLGRGFYARQDTLTPVVIGTAATVLSIPLYLLGSRHLAAHGVAGASALSLALYTALLALQWRRRFGDAVFDGLGSTARQSAGIAILAAGPGAAAILLASRIPGSPILSSAATIVSSGALFAATFFVAARLWAPDLVAPITRRFSGPGGAPRGP